MPGALLGLMPGALLGLMPEGRFLTRPSRGGGDGRN
jgi:hypothetical protein